jgi:hypothetical protein
LLAKYDILEENMDINFQALLATGVPQTIILVAGCVISAYIAIKILLKCDIPYKLAQFLEWLNSKTSHYYGIILAVLLGNMLSSIRAGGVYYIFFHTALEKQSIFGIPALLWAICGVAGIVVFFCGYYVATHRPKKGEWIAFILICIIFGIHDFAGILVTESINNTGKSTVEINAENWAGWAFCALSLVPLLLGRWLPVLEKEKKKEEAERHENFSTYHERQTQKYAINILSKTAREIPQENVWMFLPKEDQAYGKKILQIAAGTYKEDTSPEIVHRNVNTGPIQQLTGPEEIDGEAQELPFTPVPIQEEDDDLQEEDGVYSEEDLEEALQEESLGDAVGNFLKSVRTNAHKVMETIKKN